MGNENENENAFQAPQLLSNFIVIAITRIFILPIGRVRAAEQADSHVPTKKSKTAWFGLSNDQDREICKLCCSMISGMIAKVANETPPRFLKLEEDAPEPGSGVLFKKRMARVTAEMMHFENSIYQSSCILGATNVGNELSMESPE